MNNKLGQDSAFPIPAYYIQPGMSKRFYAACAAMQGILATDVRFSGGGNNVKQAIEYAYEYADELLKRENE